MYEVTVVRYNSCPDSEYIGRGNPLGNIYPINASSSRDHVCDKYDVYFYDQIRKNNVFINELKRIHKKGTEKGYIKLGCFCKNNNIPPIRCHGDTIKYYLENNQDIFLDHE